MTEKQIAQLKKMLPKHYGAAIARKLNHVRIDKKRVVRVMNGEITDPDIVIPVFDAAIELAGEKKKISTRLNKTLKAA